MKLLLALLLAAGCSPAAYPNSSADCGSMCSHLRELGCEEGGVTAGDSCEEVCRNAADSGLTPMNTACGSKIESCEQFSGC
jgi:hypothetical protein